MNELGYETKLAYSLSRMVFIQFGDGFRLKAKSYSHNYNSIDNCYPQMVFGDALAYTLDFFRLDTTSLSFQIRAGKRGSSTEILSSTAVPITRKFFISPSIGANYYSAKYTNYYFGIKPHELGGEIRLIYKLKYSYSSYASIDFTYTLTVSLVGKFVSWF
ncbi:MipA/OmpV family protein [[Haemophilus] ducreyi]|uniref:MipA/OmpV family protein n=1 Tax=Haemophilus ducreyi TaxID=730 RepID=UPI001E55CDCE|nr:MipA/OmpV family protein [[Haemophilus] ducreyi]